MAGLADIGLTGIVLGPGWPAASIRVPPGALRSGRLRRQCFHTRNGTGVDAIFGALGATTDHSGDQVRTDKARSGEFRGIEASVQNLLAVDRQRCYLERDVVREVRRRRRAFRHVGRSDRGSAGRTCAPWRSLPESRRSLPGHQVKGLERWCGLPGRPQASWPPTPNSRPPHRIAACDRRSDVDAGWCRCRRAGGGTRRRVRRCRRHDLRIARR